MMPNLEGKTSKSITTSLSTQALRRLHIGGIQLGFGVSLRSRLNRDS